MTYRSCYPVHTQEEIYPFLVPAPGASKSKQLWQRRVPHLSEGPQGSKAVPLPAGGQTTFLTVVPGEICLERQGSEQEGGERLERSAPDHGPGAPTLHHRVLSKSFPGQAWKNSPWIFIMVKLLIYKKMLLQMGKSPQNHAKDSRADPAAWHNKPLLP